MLTARKSKLFEAVFAPYNRNLLRRRFNGLRVRGLDVLRQQVNAREDVPLIVYMNHSSWWDALAPVHVAHVVGLEWYAMMEERQLKELQFFRRLGCFSVIREDARAALTSLRYAVEVLAGTNRVLAIFPQGRVMANDVRPLIFYAGAAHIVKRLERVRAAPWAIRYEHQDDYRPEIYMSIGAAESFDAPQQINIKELTAHFAARTEHELDRIKQSIIENHFGEYEEVLAKKRRT